MTPFTVPNLPTDNLYKFYAITGIVICLFSASFIILSTVKIEDDLDNISMKLARITLEGDFLDKDSERVEKLANELEKELNEYDLPKDSIFNKYENFITRHDKLRSDKDYRDYTKLLYDYEIKLFPEIQKFNKIEELKAELLTSNRKQQIKLAEIKEYNIKAKRKSRKLILTFILGLLAFIYGHKLAKKGFKLWKSKVQDIIDQKLKIELDLLLMEKNKN